MVEKYIPWGKRKFIYPWDLSKFPYPLRDKQTVLEFLRKAKYPLEKLQKKPNSDKLMRAVNGILGMVLNRKWVLAASSDAGLLQSISLVVPPCFALTALDPCRNVTTANLLELFRAKSPDDPWSSDLVGETYAQIVKTGLLTWTNVNDVMMGARMHASQFTALLSDRRLRNYPTLFTAYTSGNLERSDVVQQMFTTIQDAIGMTAMGIIKEKVTLLNLVIKHEQVKAETFAL